MSWDAELLDDHATPIGWWNYTHNTNGMIVLVLDLVGKPSPQAWWDELRARHLQDGDTGMFGARRGQGTSWWTHLDGLNATDGAALLDQIVGGLLEAPELFRRMNPTNGWGDYDSLLKTLADMRDASREHPDARWSASG